MGGRMRQRAWSVEVSSVVDADTEAFYKLSAKPAADQRQNRTAQSYDKGKRCRSFWSVVAHPPTDKKQQQCRHICECVRESNRFCPGIRWYRQPVPKPERSG